MSAHLMSFALVFALIVGVFVGYQIGEENGRVNENTRLNKFYTDNSVDPNSSSAILTNKSNDYYSKRALLRAIALTESGSPFKDSTITGDGGDSLGPLQIGTSYHSDAAYFDGKLNFYRDVTKWDYSVRCFNAYMQRWTPTSVFNAYVSDCMTLNDCEIIARTHNGGPKGRTKQSTTRHWNKVKTLITQQRF